MAKVQITTEKEKGRFHTHRWTLGNVWSDGREEFKTEDVSDGYHSFKELYRYRLLYNALFFNTLWEWEEAEGDQGFNIHKSKRHSDGEECFGGGWFIVVAQLPTGQITNHYELKDWDLFNIPEKKKAAKYDGHSPNDVAIRIEDYLRSRT